MKASIDWQKLTIPLTEVDPPRLLDAWRWLVDRPVEAIELTRCLDWFVVDASGGVHRLDILEGSFAQVCGDVNEFRARRESDETQIDWYWDGLVYAAYERGLLPGRGQGFAFRAPPILGGPIGTEHITVVDAASWQFFMAQVHEKVRALPPGALVGGLTVDGVRPTLSSEPSLPRDRTAESRETDHGHGARPRPWWKLW